MNLTPSKQFSKQSLQSHSWLGLLAGALMYLICLSGTIAVFYVELERWEQPSASEYFDYDVTLVEQRFHQILADSNTTITPHMYVTLPTQANPRVGISTETEGWYLNKDGSISSPTDHPWTDVLTDLHIHLHLPETLGLIIVSTLGVMLLALIISGFAAHRSLFRDAFKLRLFGAKQIETVDLHNRLSVWGAPFHIIIALTGAFFGLALLVLLSYAQIHHQGNTEKLYALVYGADPELNETTVKPPQIAKALTQMPKLAPKGTQPLFLIVHEANTAKQFIEIFVQYPKRLIYSDNFVFDADGNFIEQRGFANAEAGRQLVYSMYRLHFGEYGSEWVKVIYFLLGFALTYVAASGINIWLQKRKYRDIFNDLWVACVWGTPVALVVCALTRFAFAYTSQLEFWLILIGLCLYTSKLKDERKSRLHLKSLLFFSSVALVLVYCLKHQQHAFTLLPLFINTSLLLVTAALFLQPRYAYNKAALKSQL